jgi:hypothetical protein
MRPTCKPQFAVSWQLPHAKNPPPTGNLPTRTVQPHPLAAPVSRYYNMLKTPCISKGGTGRESTP